MILFLEMRGEHVTNSFFIALQPSESALLLFTSSTGLQEQAQLQHRSEAAHAGSLLSTSLEQPTQQPECRPKCHNKLCNHHRSRPPATLLVSAHCE